MKTPLFGSNGEAIGIQGIFWDVTQRMRAEELLKEQNVTLQELARSEQQAHLALKTAQSRMVQTEKLASLGQLVAGVAHEINNPLAFVSNNVAVLERDLLDLVELVNSIGGRARRRETNGRRSMLRSINSSSNWTWTTRSRTCPGSSSGPAKDFAGSNGSSRISGSSPASTRASGTRLTSTPASNPRSASSRAMLESTASRSRWI